MRRHKYRPISYGSAYNAASEQPPAPTEAVVIYTTPGDPRAIPFQNLGTENEEQSPSGEAIVTHTGAHRPQQVRFIDASLPAPEDNL